MRQRENKGQCSQGVLQQNIYFLFSQMNNPFVCSSLRITPTVEILAGTVNDELYFFNGIFFSTVYYYL